VVADRGSYFVTTYKRNRQIGGLKLKRERKGKERLIEKGRRRKLKT